ncbi:MAG: MBOAT family protein [Agathobacter sp.]|nr:MBOAT family protein [Agathobacter sp.]
MVFSETTFLYAFFPLVIGLYFVWNNLHYRNFLLLAFSLIFYAWGEPKYIVLMLLASVVAYVGGLLINKYDERKAYKKKKIVFIITVVLLVANLLVFKYLNFFCENVSAVLHITIPLKEIALPIGISFYTFQILSYVIDLYRKEIKVQKNFFYLTLYVSFFPQLIAGPIVRYITVEDEIRNRNSSMDDIVIGLKRFIIGMAKKVIIANNVAKIAETIYGSNSDAYGTAFFWIAAIAYTLQIYFDFSGYSDMAIGLGRIFGFHFLENFNYPYISTSITEFWRRWHISLSTWFRDYIYIPLGGNRVKKSRWLFNIFVVWCLTGFWHGAEWNFIFWGLYYCALLLLEKLFLHKVLDKLPKIGSWIYTMILVIIGWVMFNLVDFEQMLFALKTMFIYRPSDFIGAIAADSSLLYGFIYIPLGIVFSFPIFRRKEAEKENVFLLGLENIGYIGIFMICIIYTISSSYNPFIYFRF